MHSHDVQKGREVEVTLSPAPDTVTDSGLWQMLLSDWQLHVLLLAASLGAVGLLQFWGGCPPFVGGSDTFLDTCSQFAVQGTTTTTTKPLTLSPFQHFGRHFILYFQFFFGLKYLT